MTGPIPIVVVVLKSRVQSARGQVCSWQLPNGMRERSYLGDHGAAARTARCTGHRTRPDPPPRRGLRRCVHIRPGPRKPHFVFHRTLQHQARTRPAYLRTALGYLLLLNDRLRALVPNGSGPNHVEHKQKVSDEYRRKLRRRNPSGARAHAQLQFSPRGPERGQQATAPAAGARLKGWRADVLSLDLDALHNPELVMNLFIPTEDRASPSFGAGGFDHGFEAHRRRLFQGSSIQ